MEQSSEREAVARAGIVVTDDVEAAVVVLAAPGLAAAVPAEHRYQILHRSHQWHLEKIQLSINMLGLFLHLHLMKLKN